MILLGLLLLLLGAGIGTITYLAASSQSERIHIAAYGFSRDAGALELVLLGAGTVVILAIGWAYIAAWLRRQARLRREDDEDSRLDELDERHRQALAEKDRQLTQAAAREQELTHQLRELSVREAEFEIRARELALRETQWQDRVGTFDTDVSMRQVPESGWDRPWEPNETSTASSPWDSKQSSPWASTPSSPWESTPPSPWEDAPPRPVLRRRRNGG